MRTVQVFAGLMVLALALCACRTITVQTTVFADGSFIRTVIVKGDSVEVLKGDLPSPVDSTWKATKEQDTAKAGGWVVTYTKDYENSSELNEEIAADTGAELRPEHRVDITSRYRFFYSYIEYRESYASDYPFSEVPYKDYFTAKEYRWAFGLPDNPVPADTVRAKEVMTRIFTYIAISAATSLEKSLNDALRQADDSVRQAFVVPAYGDSMKAYMAGWNLDSLEDFTDSIGSWAQEPLAVYLRGQCFKPVEEWDGKWKRFSDILGTMGYKNQVLMPGMLSSSNGDSVSGTLVSWNFDSFDCLIVDFEMKAESRVTNIWAFVITGLVIAGGVVWLVRKKSLQAKGA